MKIRLLSICVATTVAILVVYEIIPHASFSFYEKYVAKTMNKSFLSGQYDRAQVSVDWLLNRHPKNKQLIFNKACICVKQNNWSNARQLLRNLIIASPNDIEAKKLFLIAVEHTGGTDDLLSAPSFFVGFPMKPVDRLPMPMY